MRSGNFGVSAMVESLTESYWSTWLNTTRVSRRVARAYYRLRDAVLSGLRLQTTIARIAARLTHLRAAERWMPKVRWSAYALLCAVLLTLVPSTGRPLHVQAQETFEPDVYEPDDEA